MKCEETIRILSAHKNEIYDMGIKTISVFGSTSRNEANENSDIDLLVEFNKPIGLFEFVRIRRKLSQMLGKPVDLVTEAALRENMRTQILKEAIRAA